MGGGGGTGVGGGRQRGAMGGVSHDPQLCGLFPVANARPLSNWPFFPIRPTGRPRLPVMGYPGRRNHSLSLFPPPPPPPKPAPSTLLETRCLLVRGGGGGGGVF